jgi:hypothetical protein
MSLSQDLDNEIAYTAISNLPKSMTVFGRDVERR